MNQAIQLAMNTLSSAIDAAIDAAVSAAVAAIPPPPVPDYFLLVDKTGRRDETDRVQKALDLGLPLPAGIFLIDAVRGLTSTRNVFMDPDTHLVTTPNGAERYCLLHVIGDDLEVQGGKLYGDRYAHDYTIVGTHEHGTGLQLSGNRIKVYNTEAVDFTGDGIMANGDDIELHNVISTQSRRNNMSLFNVKRFRAYDCEFSHAGKANGQPGAAKGPWAGVDCEPDHGSADDIIFERCRFIGNQSSDFLCWSRTGTGASITNVQLIECVLDGGANGLDAKGLGGPVTITALRNILSNHSGSSFKVEAGATVNIGNSNVADANVMNFPRARAAKSGAGLITPYDIQVSGTGVANVGFNKYA